MNILVACCPYFFCAFGIPSDLKFPLQFLKVVIFVPDGTLLHKLFLPRVFVDRFGDSLSGVVTAQTMDGVNSAIKFSKEDGSFSDMHDLLANFYERDDIDFTSKAYLNKSDVDPLGLVLHHEYVKSSSIDSGIYMVTFAEYLADKKEIPQGDLDIGAHRSRLSFLFYSYGMAKQIYGYESEGEAALQLPGSEQPAEGSWLTNSNTESRDIPAAENLNEDWGDLQVWINELGEVELTFEKSDDE
ncbi:hypothetical protein ACET3Z_027952 [Daucus carota]